MEPRLVAVASVKPGAVPGPLPRVMPASLTGRLIRTASMLRPSNGISLLVTRTVKVLSAPGYWAWPATRLAVAAAAARAGVAGRTARAVAAAATTAKTRRFISLLELVGPAGVGPVEGKVSRRAAGLLPLFVR